MKAKVIIAAILILTGLSGACYYWFAQNPEAKQKYLGMVQGIIQKDKQPSKKALKVASFLFVRLSDDKLRRNKSSFGDEDMNDVDFVREWALKMDSDPASLAVFEAAMEKKIAEESKSVKNTYNTYERPSTSDQTIQPNLETGNYSDSVSDRIRQSFEKSEQQQKEDCQRKWAEYNTCLSEYNAKVSEYNLCLSDPLKAYCSKPTKYCSKPFCSL